MSEVLGHTGCLLQHRGSPASLSSLSRSSSNSPVMQKADTKRGCRYASQPPRCGRGLGRTPESNRATHMSRFTGWKEHNLRRMSLLTSPKPSMLRFAAASRLRAEVRHIVDFQLEFLCQHLSGTNLLISLVPVLRRLSILMALALVEFVGPRRDLRRQIGRRRFFGVRWRISISGLVSGFASALGSVKSHPASARLLLQALAQQLWLRA